jgi:hypothetical protein
MFPNPGARRLLLNYMSLLRQRLPIEVVLLDCTPWDAGVEGGQRLLAQRVKDRGEKNSTLTPARVPRFEQIVGSVLRDSVEFDVRREAGADGWNLDGGDAGDSEPWFRGVVACGPRADQESVAERLDRALDSLQRILDQRTAQVSGWMWPSPSSSPSSSSRADDVDRAAQVALSWSFPPVKPEALVCNSFACQTVVADLGPLVRAVMRALSSAHPQLNQDASRALERAAGRFPLADLDAKGDPQLFQFLWPLLCHRPQGRLVVPVRWISAFWEADSVASEGCLGVELEVWGDAEGTRRMGTTAVLRSASPLASSSLRVSAESESPMSTNLNLASEMKATTLP